MRIPTSVGRHLARTGVWRSIIASLSIATILVLSACAAPRIDGSSDEAFRASVVKVRESLPESDKARFDKAVLAISMDGALVRALSGASRDAMQRQVRDRLAGKTAAEVLAEADQLEAQAKPQARPDAQKAR
jgi:uncharacterized protein DUF6694